MSILIDKSTRLVVQGITGRDGAFHTQQMLDYGTKVVAGVTPGKGGEVGARRAGLRHRGRGGRRHEGQRLGHLRARAPFAADAIYEAADAGVGLIVCITEGLPVLDSWRRGTTWRRCAERSANGKPRLLGPNCPGLISPGQSKVGIMPGRITQARAGGRRLAQRARSPTRSSSSSRRPGSARPPASGSAATRSSAPTSSTP